MGCREPSARETLHAWFFTALVALNVVMGCGGPSAGETLRAWLLSALVVHGAVAGNPDAKRLYDDLLSNYNKLVRPVVNTTDVLRVCIKLKLSQLIDVRTGIVHPVMTSLPAVFCQVDSDVITTSGGPRRQSPVMNVLGPVISSIVRSPRFKFLVMFLRS
ncbi:acetylcholine-gated cation-selective channel activity protein [Homalodisca vitripennis]|nr:acetylcholine-gated cation-selective channel activity protein [Homalodisca vitripennis]